MTNQNISATVIDNAVNSSVILPVIEGLAMMLTDFCDKHPKILARFLVKSILLFYA